MPTPDANFDPFAYDERLGRLRRFVEEHYDESISAARAASIAGLAEKYFSTFFRERIGMPFGRWLRQFRVRRAKELLSTRDMNVGEVAFEVGFGDLSTFHRAFKAAEDVTPAQYRRRMIASYRLQESPYQTPRQAAV